MGSRDFDGGFRLSDCEPKEWFIVFHDHSPTWWIKWLACGRFKHVSIFGKVDRSASWIFYDFHLNKAHIMVVGDWEADAALGFFADQGTVVRFPRMFGDAKGFAMRPGWWCVPAVAHILGIKSCALRPDALFRQCLAKGGEIVGPEGQKNESSQGRGRSGTEAPADGREPGKGEHDPGQADV